ncbi:MAG: YeeE/YedE family protein [Acetobacteraceae bacterium]
MELLIPPVAAPLIGLVIGFCCGAAARRARMCSFGAIEDAVAGGDFLRLRAFALALAIAVAGTQLLIGLNLLPAVDIALLPPRFPWAGALVGGCFFGLGMALVGTCTFGALVRLGGGDLRALVVLIVFAAVVWATVSGPLSIIRLRLLDPLAPTLETGGGTTLPVMIGGAGVALVLIPAALVALLALWALAERRLRRSRSYLLFGLAMGGGVIAGWLVTGVLVDAFEATPRPQGLSFVTPVARLMQALVLQPGPAVDFAIASVVGVPLGAVVSAARMGETRLEAFDDAREMIRHLLGALLMGTGGVWAGGCTIGQGLSAGSLLAPSMPLAVGGIFAGAWVGILILLEGGPGAAVQHWIARLRA